MEIRQRKTRKRLLINIDEDMHTDIKKICAEKRISITYWILTAIIEQLKKERDLGF